MKSVKTFVKIQKLKLKMKGKLVYLFRNKKI